MLGVVLYRYRQGGVGYGMVPMEDAWRTDDWRVRHVCAMLDFSRTNAFMAWKRYSPDKDLRTEPAKTFCLELAYELIDNPWWNTSTANPLFKEGAAASTRHSNGVPELEEVASSAVTPTAEPRRERFPVPNWARDEL